MAAQKRGEIGPRAYPLLTELAFEPAFGSAAPRKMTPHQRQEAMQRLAAGETQADVARTYNVDATTIGRLLGDRPFLGDASRVALQ
jgi:hypothetical protein